MRRGAESPHGDFLTKYFIRKRKKTQEEREK
jgi:hypothetical protein